MNTAAHWQNAALAALTESDFIAVWELRLTQDVLYVNDAFLRLAGSIPGPYQNGLDALRAFAHPEDRAELNTLFAACLKDKRQYIHSYRLLRQDGSVRWVKEYATAVSQSEDGRPDRVTAMLLDITADKTTVLNLQANISQREFMARISGMGGWTLRASDLELHLDEDYMGLLGREGLPAKGHVYDVMRNISPEADLRHAIECLKAHMKNPVGLLIFEIRVKRKDGEYIWLQNTASVSQWDEDGKPLLYTGNAININAYRHDIERRNILLRTINRVISRLMASQPEAFGKALLEAMSLIAEAANADRISVRQNVIVDGRLISRQLHSWNNPTFHTAGTMIEGDIPFDHFPYFRDSVNNGTIINARVCHLPEPERSSLEQIGAKVVLLIPVYLREELWGAVFYEYRRDDAIPDGETERMLQSASHLILSSIARNEGLRKLIEAREEALSSARAKSEFLSRMSHEIRTPMNAIIGMTTIALRSTDRDKINDCLYKIDGSSARLLEIINDVLDISKIDANKFEIVREPFPFEQMLHKVQSEIQLRMAEKRQEFIYDLDCVFDRMMLGDDLRLSQVLLNLLSNAVKFTPEGGKIRLKVRRQAKSANVSKLTIEVQDNGIGIPPERMDRLFMAFEQGDGSITRRYGGTGLGLAICKKLVDLMGGRIFAESKEGVGSRFVVELDAEWGEPISAESKPRRLKRNLHVLVVDDSGETLDYFKTILEGFGIYADTALSGHEALELVKQSMECQTPYDVIFMDWFMPGLNGGDTSLEIKKIMGFDVLIIMISAGEWSEIDADIGSFGIKRFLQKPVLPSALYDALFLFSARGAEDSEAAISRPLRPNWQGKRVLLVEDIEINREIVIAMLEDTCLEIDVARNGLEALQLFEAHPDRYHLIIMDVQMPVLDGLSATRRIRALPHPAGLRVPIVAMTADAFKENELECLDAGMNAYISKPVEEKYMFQTLSKYL